MTKAERIQLIRKYFQVIGRIDGAIPCLQWKHQWEPDVYLYSREDESLSLNEVVIVKSPAKKIDRAIKYANKHYFQTVEELDVLLRSLSAYRGETENGHRPAEQEEEGGSTVKPPYRPHPSSNAKTPAASRGFSFPPAFSAVLLRVQERPLSPLKLAVALFLLILLVTFCTNPSEEKHRAAVAEEEGATMGNPLSDRVHRKNFILFSLTELRRNGKTDIIGTGMFGKVWLSEPEGDLYQASGGEAAKPAAELGVESDAKEQEALKKEMKRAIIVAVTEKRVEELDPRSPSEYVFVFHNRSNRNVKSFHGTLRFYDKSENKLYSLPLTYNRFLGIGERVICPLASENDPDRLLQTMDLEKLIVEWEPSEILYNDGLKLSLKG